MFSGNEDTVYGLMYEANARDCFERKNSQSQVVQTGILINPILPWLGYSADGIVCEENNTVNETLWECKSLKAGRKKTAAELKTAASCMDPKKEGKLKDHHPYYGQIQLGMLLYELHECYFNLYSSKDDDVYIDTVMFNEKFCLKMIDTLTEIYFKHILPFLCKKKG